MEISVNRALSFLLLLVLPASLMADEKLTLTMRSRAKDAPAKEIPRKVEWKASATALIICDMWDDHWCKSAARRVEEMTGPLNEVVKKLRDQGVFIIHAPSSVVDFYQNTPQRRYAQNAPFAKPPIKLSTKDRWGTKWCWPDPEFEGVLPIDDSDMGCSCKEPKCEIREAWTRQPASGMRHPGQIEQLNRPMERFLHSLPQSDTQFATARSIRSTKACSLKQKQLYPARQRFRNWDSMTIS